jgi:hypothetical protein
MAWEEFKYPSHMKAVSVGDIVFMYANRVGIIGIGQATGACEMAVPIKDSSRIYKGTESPEWRIPVRWLCWQSDDTATPWGGRTVTFCNISTQKYSMKRQEVLRHFHGQLNEEIP